MVAALLLAPAAHAAQQPSKEDLDEAKMHFNVGKIYYDKAKYAKAVAEFEAGYELVKKPAFLLNIAQCHRKLGDIAKAREFYARYLEGDPQSPQKGQVEKIVADLDLELAAANAAGVLPSSSNASAAPKGQRETPPAPEPVSDPEPEPAVPDEERRPVPAAALPGSDDDPELAAATRRRKKSKGKDDDEDGAPFYGRAWFWTLVGVGLVGGGATAFYLNNSAKKDFLDEGTLGVIDATTKIKM